MGRARILAWAAFMWVSPAGAQQACAVTDDCTVGEHCIERVCRTASFVPPPPLKSYGVQIAAADAGALVTLGLGSVLSGPIVHLAHRRYATALASFGLRVFGIALSGVSGVGLALALPPASFNALGCFRCPPSPDYLPQMFVGLLVGAGIGWIASAVIDAVFLARTR